MDDARLAADPTTGEEPRGDAAPGRTPAAGAGGATGRDRPDVDRTDSGPALVLMRRAYLLVIPLALGVVLWFHPPGGGGPDVYEGLRHDVGAWLFVHTVLLVFIPLMAIAALLLLGSLRSRAAMVSRVSLVFFLVFYTAYEVTVGLGAGILAKHANGLPPSEQATLADAIQHYAESDLLGDPISVSVLLGVLAWSSAMIAAAVALHHAGAGWPVTLLVGFGAAFAVHEPPIGPVALVCFAVAGVLIERWRAGKPATPERSR